jgi:hypothetical protein
VLVTVVVITVTLKPEVDANEFGQHYADLIRDSGHDTGEVVEVTYEGVLEEPAYSIPPQGGNA